MQHYIENIMVIFTRTESNWFHNHSNFLMSNVPKRIVFGGDMYPFNQNNKYNSKSFKSLMSTLPIN